MKKIIPAIAFALISICLNEPIQAQTNTFPTTGNAGIGTTNPGYLLEVNTTSVGEQSSLGIQQVNTAGNPVNMPTTRLIYNWYATPKASVNFHRGNAASDGFMSFSTSSNNVLVERVRIGSYGNVGIGTTALPELLNVVGNIYANPSVNGGLRLQNTTGTSFWINVPTVNLLSIGGTGTTAPASGAINIDEAGNIGIGTTTPGARLDIGVAEQNRLSAVLGRLPEGNGAGSGTYLGVRNLQTSPVNSMSFSLEHRFYGSLNSAINFHRGGSTTGGFLSFSTNDGTEKMRLDVWGNLGIGTADTKGYKLAVNGSAIFTKVTIKQAANWPDYVFEPAYQLPSLQSVQQYIKSNKHLPDMPSAVDVAREGIDIGNIQAALLKKVEELTLYMIDLKKENEQIKQENAEMKNRLENLEKR
jgi:hypothetical protein